MKYIIYLLIIVSGSVMAENGHKTHTLIKQSKLDNGVIVCEYSGKVVTTQSRGVCKATIKK